MPTAPHYPSICDINTRVWLERRSREAGRRITLADIDDATIDAFAEQAIERIAVERRIGPWMPGSSLLKSGHDERGNA
jgi:hypothetical protein